jgi:hypothetical protein
LEDCFDLVRISFNAFGGDMTPEYFAVVTPKTHFFGLSLRLASRILVKVSARVGDVRCFLITCHDYIINIR